MSTSTETRDALATAGLAVVSAQRMADDPAAELPYKLRGLTEFALNIAEHNVDTAARAHVATLDLEAGGA